MSSDASPPKPLAEPQVHDLLLGTPAGSDDPDLDFEDAASSSDEDENHVEPTVLTPELTAGLVKQIEFYFSDANLPTDKKLLKQIKKDTDGFVPVKLFANFRKVRALTKDVSLITQALASSEELQLSGDQKRIRRRQAIPDYDISDIQRRTVVVERLPPTPTIESVTDMFKRFGRVKLVRICSKESKGKLPSWLTNACSNITQQHAFVEFETEEAAVAAVQCLHEADDWRSGLQVRHLVGSRNSRPCSRAASQAGSRPGSRRSSREPSPSCSPPVSSSYITRNSPGGSRGSLGGSRPQLSSSPNGPRGMGSSPMQTRLGFSTGGSGTSSPIRHSAGGAAPGSGSLLSAEPRPGAYIPPGRRSQDAHDGSNVSSGANSPAHVGSPLRSSNLGAHMEKLQAIRTSPQQGLAGAMRSSLGGRPPLAPGRETPTSASAAAAAAHSAFVPPPSSAPAAAGAAPGPFTPGTPSAAPSSTPTAAAVPTPGQLLPAVMTPAAPCVAATPAPTPAPAAAAQPAVPVAKAAAPAPAPAASKDPVASLLSAAVAQVLEQQGSGELASTSTSNGGAAALPPAAPAAAASTSTSAGGAAPPNLLPLRTNLTSGGGASSTDPSPKPRRAPKFLLDVAQPSPGTRSHRSSCDGYSSGANSKGPSPRVSTDGIVSRQHAGAHAHGLPSPLGSNSQLHLPPQSLAPPPAAAAPAAFDGQMVDDVAGFLDSLLLGQPGQQRVAATPPTAAELVAMGVGAGRITSSPRDISGAGPYVDDDLDPDIQRFKAVLHGADLSGSPLSGSKIEPLGGQSRSAGKPPRPGGMSGSESGTKGAGRRCSWSEADQSVLGPEAAVALLMRKTMVSEAGSEGLESDSGDEDGDGDGGDPGKRRRRRRHRRSRRTSMCSDGAGDMPAGASGTSSARPTRPPSTGGSAACSQGGHAPVPQQAQGHNSGHGQPHVEKEKTKEKKPTKKDYAAWAAATPEFRAEAVAKYHSTGGSSSVQGGGSGTGSARVSHSGHAGEGAPTSAGGSGHGHSAAGHVPHHAGPHAPGHPHAHAHPHHELAHIAKGPDGSKGFMGRGKPLPHA